MIGNDKRPRELDMATYSISIDAAVRFANNLGLNGVETARILGFEITQDDELPCLIKHAKLYPSHDVDERVWLLVNLMGELGVFYEKESFPEKFREARADLKGESLYSLAVSGDLADFTVAVDHLWQMLAR